MAYVFRRPSRSYLRERQLRSREVSNFSLSVTLTGVGGTGAVGILTTTSASGGNLSITLAGVAGTGRAGTLVGGVSGATLTGVAGTGGIGELTSYYSLASTPRLTLSNVIRRLRLLGNWTAPRARNMYVGRDFDPANPTESEIYTLDFVNELSTGETLVSVSSVGFTVFQGTDSNPSSHLSGSASISDTKVSQRIGGDGASGGNMTSGVTYTLSFTVLTSLSNTITLFSRIACRPIQ